MPNRYRIESIDQPTRYWHESHAVRGWFPDKGAASQFGEGDRKTMPLPVGGLWVIVDEPKRERVNITTIRLRPIALRIAAVMDSEDEFASLNEQVNEFEAALRQWVKKQQILNGSEWSVDVICEDG